MSLTFDRDDGRFQASLTNTVDPSVLTTQANTSAVNCFYVCVCMHVYVVMCCVVHVHVQVCVCVCVCLCVYMYVCTNHVISWTESNSYPSTSVSLQVKVQEG